MSSLYKGLVLGLAVGGCGILVALTPLGLGVEENIGLDLLFMLRGQRPAPGDVVIISIDRESARRLDLPREPIKWPRTMHARLIEQLSARGVVAIGFDVLFKEQRAAKEDQALTDAIEAAGNVVLFEYLDKRILSGGGQAGAAAILEQLIPPTPLLAQSALALAPFPLPKVPAKISQVWTFKPSAGSVPTMPLVVFQVYALSVYRDFRALLAQVSPQQVHRIAEHSRDIVQHKKLREHMLTLRRLFTEDPGLAGRMSAALQSSPSRPKGEDNTALLQALISMYQVEDSQYLNYYGPSRSITTIPYYRLVREDSEPVPDLNGKAVFIGLSEPMQLERVDTFYTPFSQPDGVDLSGVEIAATVFANLLEDQAVRPAGPALLFALLLLWGLSIGVLGRVFSTGIAIGGGIGMSGLYLAGAYVVFGASALWVPLVVPLLLQTPLALFGAVLWKYIDTNRERKKIRKAFGYYLPERVVDDITDNFAKGRHSRNLVFGTCLATDAEQYTALSETMDPGDLGELMDRYYETLFLPVRQCNGFVSDVIGDAMMAIWVVTASKAVTTSRVMMAEKAIMADETPLRPDIEHRVQACRAALEMAAAVDKFNASSKHPELPTRIGLHSGEMLIGNIGAVDHYEYRAVGDIVNTASRIQGLNKHLGTRLLVSAQVIEGQDDLLARNLGQFLLVGKSKPVRIYELLNLLDKATGEAKELCAEFTKALDLYQVREWGQALEMFLHLKSRYKQDGPTRFYLQLCRRFLNHPPDDQWSSVVQMHKK